MRARTQAAFGLVVALTWATSSPAADLAAMLRWDFSKRPTKDEQVAATPADIKAKGVVGDATALCEVVGGRLESCKVIDEHPSDAGFGRALLALAPLYELPKMKLPACENVFNRVLITAGWPDNDSGPTFTKRPTAQVLTRFYPSKAQGKGFWGASAVRCEVPAEGGAPRNCKVIHEYPAGYGFGTAMLKLAPMYRLSGAVRNGQPVADNVVIPFNFVYANVC